MCREITREQPAFNNGDVVTSVIFHFPDESNTIYREKMGDKNNKKERAIKRKSFESDFNLKVVVFWGYGCFLASPS